MTALLMSFRGRANPRVGAAPTSEDTAGDGVTSHRTSAPASDAAHYSRTLRLWPHPSHHLRPLKLRRVESARRRKASPAEAGNSRSPAPGRVVRHLPKSSESSISGSRRGSGSTSAPGRSARPLRGLDRHRRPHPGDVLSRAVPVPLRRPNSAPLGTISRRQGCPDFGKPYRPACPKLGRVAGPAGLGRADD